MRITIDLLLPVIRNPLLTFELQISPHNDYIECDCIVLDLLPLDKVNILRGNEFAKLLVLLNSQAGLLSI